MMPTVKWQPASPRPVALPGKDEIHLWQIDLDHMPADTDVLYGTLSASERERARRLIFEKQRRRYVAARGWLRSVLSSYLNLPAHAVPLAVSFPGKPCMVPGADPCGLQFNLSHCDGQVFLAVTTRREIGVDLQRAPEKADWPAIAKRFFTPEEYGHLQTLPMESRAPVFAEIWTRKEAAGKATGEGLTSRIFSTVVGPAEWGTVDCGEGLSVWSLPTRDRFAAAIAVQQPL